MTLTGEIPPNITGYHSVDLLWTLADSRRARREGWDICVSPGGGLEIDSTGETHLPFAMQHCMNFAEVSQLHAKALAIHFYNLATRREG